MNDSLQLKALVNGAYDLQKLRIQTGLRIVANYKVRLGQAPGERETELSDDSKRLLAEMRIEYKRITDALIETGKRRNIKFPAQSLITDEVDYALMRQYVSLESEESTQFKTIEKRVKNHILMPFCETVKGFGPAMLAVVIACVDIHKCSTPSKLWAYCGLDVASDGRGRSRRKEHLVEREYINKNGEKSVRASITFNPFLKTKMVGVLGPCLLKAGGEYATIYRDYKHRLETNPAHAEKTNGHRHNMAMRYMVKMFLLNLWLFWRAAEGLPVRDLYSAEKQHQPQHS